MSESDIQDAVIALLEESSLTVLQCLTVVLHRPGVQDAVKSYPLLMFRDERDLELLKNLVRAEVIATQTSFALFRETTVPSLILSTYSHMIAHRFLFDVLHRPIMEVIREGYTCDEPQHLASMCSKIVERLGDSVEHMPRTLGIVHHALLDVVSQKFPNEKYTALSGLFLLRLVCPAITAPVQYHMVPKHIEMPLKTLKFLAMVSKVILMMGVGSSFKEGDKHENLNMLLSELSPSVLLILDTVADIGVSVMEAEPDGRKSRDSGSKASRAGRRQQRRTLYKSASDVTRGHATVVMPDGQVLKIKVDKTTSADTIMELVMRLKCPSAERDDDGRAAYADHYLFKGPCVQDKGGSVQKRPGGHSYTTAMVSVGADELCLCEGEDLIWDSTELSTLWLLPVDDDEELESCRKERDRIMERVVVITIDESSWKLKKSFADSNVMMTVNEVLEFLCNKHYGSCGDGHMLDTEARYGNWWLYAVDEKTGSHRLLLPAETVTQVVEYNSAAAPCIFKKASEVHQRHVAAAKTRLRLGDNARSITGLMRVQIEESVYKTLPVNRGTTTLEAIDLVLQKLGKDSSEFRDFWLFEPREQLVDTRPQEQTTKDTKRGFNFLRIAGTKSDSKSDDREDKTEPSLEEQQTILGPLQPVWRRECEPELIFRKECSSEERQKLHEVLESFVFRHPEYDSDNKMIVSARSKLYMKRKRAVMALTKVLRDHFEAIEKEARRRQALFVKRRDEMHSAQRTSTKVDRRVSMALTSMMMSGNQEELIEKALAAHKRFLELLETPSANASPIRPRGDRSTSDAARGGGADDDRATPLKSSPLATGASTGSSQGADAAHRVKSCEERGASPAAPAHCRQLQGTPRRKAPPRPQASPGRKMQEAPRKGAPSRDRMGDAAKVPVGAAAGGSTQSPVPLSGTRHTGTPHPRVGPSPTPAPCPPAGGGRESPHRLKPSVPSRRGRPTLSGSTQEVMQHLRDGDDSKGDEPQ